VEGYCEECGIELTDDQVEDEKTECPWCSGEED
jgi:hypothetical protein